MKVEKIIVGSFKENCYILSNQNDVLIIDPGDEPTKIKKAIGNRNILGVLITHKHFDHVGALPFFKEYKEYSNENLKEQEYSIGPFNFSVIKTPGHKEDAISFYFKKEKMLFSGDFLFYETVGRCDLPGGSIEDMQRSIDKIKKYPHDIKVYPGHGTSTTLEHEIENNIYFREE